MISGTAIVDHDFDPSSALVPSGLTSDNLAVGVFPHNPSVRFPMQEIHPLGVRHVAFLAVG